MTLPPGQRWIEGFPRFGTHLNQPPPEVPADPEIQVVGAVTTPFSLSLAELAALPRRSVTSDFHCVAGWSATDLHWEGVAFEEVFRTVLAPAAEPGADITHLVFEGLDGYRSIVELEDALGPDVLLADRLDGQPLNGAHGAPVRLVSPEQYGFISTKHLCRIELHAEEPPGRYHPSWFVQGGLQMVKPHRRARVWHEERHRYLPARVVRPIYHRIVPLLRSLGDRRR